MEGYCMIIHCEGPDNVGKTHIAHALASKYNLAYWKNDDNKVYQENNPGMFLSILRFHYSQFPRMSQLFESKCGGIVFDRNFISEWVYSNLFRRGTDDDLICLLEEEYAKLHTAGIVYCYKTGYDYHKDDHINVEQVDKIRDLYQYYLNNRVKMPVLRLDTTNEDIDSQLEKIDDWQRAFHLGGRLL